MDEFRLRNYAVPESRRVADLSGRHTRMFGSLRRDGYPRRILPDGYCWRLPPYGFAKDGQ